MSSVSVVPISPVAEPKRSWYKTQLSEYKFNKDKKILEKLIVSLIKAREGHEAVGLPPGSPAYQDIWKTANHAISSFCTKWNQPFDSIALRIPQLRVMEDYAENRVKTLQSKIMEQVAPIASMAIVGIVPVSIAATCLFATCHTLYLWLNHWGIKAIMYHSWW